jgi:hypothetical protein
MPDEQGRARHPRRERVSNIMDKVTQLGGQSSYTMPDNDQPVVTRGYVDKRYGRHPDSDRDSQGQAIRVGSHVMNRRRGNLRKAGRHTCGHHDKSLRRQPVLNGTKKAGPMRNDSRAGATRAA